jgi:hypothetical protein
MIKGKWYDRGYGVPPSQQEQTREKSIQAIHRQVSPSADLLLERDRRAELDRQARASDVNVLLGLTPPFHRSALAQRQALPEG